MFLMNIFKLLIIIFLVYFVVNVFKYLIYFNRNVEQKIKNQKRKGKGPGASGNAGNDRIIELDKDQYKVE